MRTNVFGRLIQVALIAWTIACAGVCAYDLGEIGLVAQRASPGLAQALAEEALRDIARTWAIVLLVPGAAAALLYLVCGRSAAQARHEPADWTAHCGACRSPVHPEATICPHCRTQRATAEQAAPRLAEPS